MNQQRAAVVRQYVVLHLKEIELLHLMLLSIHLSDTGVFPQNVMGHGADRFKETLLGAIVSMFMAISDNPKTSTNARAIWKQLYPAHVKAIDRVWDRQIAPGEAVMKSFRDQAGAHGDRLGKYIAAKLGLFQHSAAVLDALHAFFGLSLCLINRQVKEQPQLDSEVEAVLLDIELGSPWGSFNRKWLKEMHLIQRGNYSKIFR